MEANAVAPTLAKAARIWRDDAGARRDRRDRPARSLVLPARCTSVEVIAFVRVPVKMLRSSRLSPSWSGRSSALFPKDAKRRAKNEAQRLARQLLRGTKYEEESLRGAHSLFSHPALNQVFSESPVGADLEARNPALSDQLVNRGLVDLQQVADFFYRQDFMIDFHRVHDALPLLKIENAHSPRTRLVKL